MEFIDVHCHYEDSRFDCDREEVISSLPFNGVKAFIDAGCTLEDSIKIKNLSEKYEYMYFCAGVHPENAGDFNGQTEQKLKELYAHPKCVGAGEIGLDFHWDENPPKEKQINTFLKQINLAREANLPAVIHCRDAIGVMLDLIKSENITGALMHCFSESKETAKICLDNGMYFSFGGTCTFKNSVRAVENLKYIPKDRIMLETDSPYLAPVPNRGKRNDSSNIVHIIEHIAMLWNMTPDEVADITTENAINFFKKGNFNK